MKRIGVFGGSFDPPGIHHYLLVKALLPYFDKVRIVPCGPRPDKLTVNNIDPIHRAAMVDLNFSRISRKVRIDLFDLEQNSFTPTHVLQEIYAKEGDVWHVIGSDLIQGGSEGKSFIQLTWMHGRKVWSEFNFAVFERPGFPFRRTDLPPKSMVIKVDFEGSSSEIRDRIYKRLPLDGLLLKSVQRYVERYNIYLSRLEQNSGLFEMERPAFLIKYDKTNPDAAELARRLKPFEHSDPECIIVIGGDGTILHYARKYWRQRLPILGINAGHLGFLSNGSDEIFKGGFPPKVLKVWNLPLLYVETEDTKGGKKSTLAFNDAYVRNKTNYRRRKLQSAWIDVRVTGLDNYRIAKLVGDGALVATTQGSSAYAKAMGATPIRLDTSELIVVGNNVFSPDNWNWAPLAINSEIEFLNLDPDKRPIEGFADSDLLGELVSMKIRTSKIANVQLAFLLDHDLARKQAEIYFPKLVTRI